MKSKPHASVMQQEFLEAFAGKEIRTFYEGTLGAGGHARALLEAHPEIERYYAVDQDPEAIAIAKEVLAPWSDKIIFIHDNFENLENHIEGKVDGFFLTWEYRLCN